MTIDAALYALALAILTTVWRVQDLFPALGVFRPAILSIIIAAFLLALDRSPERRSRRFATPLTAPLLVLLGLMALLIPASLDPQLSFSMLAQELIPTAALALMIAMAVRNGRDLEWLVMVNVVGACFYGLYALLRIPLGPEGRWTNLVGYDNNDFALLVVTTIPMALFLAQSGRTRVWRAIGFAGTALLMLCIVRAGSRGGLIGLGSVFGYLAFRHRTVRSGMRVALVVAALVVLTVFGRAQLVNTINTLRNPKADYNWSGNDYDGRIELWKRGLGYMHDRPLTGVGLAAFPVAEGELSEVARQRVAHGEHVKALVAHNMYIQVGAELGLVAAGVFLFLLWRAYRTLTLIAGAYEPTGADRPSLLKAGPETTLPRLLAASLVGFCVSAIFIAAAYFALLPVLIGFAGAASRIVPAWITAPRRRPVYAGSAAVGSEVGSLGV